MKKMYQSYRNIKYIICCVYKIVQICCMVQMEGDTDISFNFQKSQVTTSATLLIIIYLRGNILSIDIIRYIG